MLIKSQSEVRLHTGRSVHFHPGRCARPSFSIFRGSGSETKSKAVAAWAEEVGQGHVHKMFILWSWFMCKETSVENYRDKYKLIMAWSQHDLLTRSKKTVWSRPAPWVKSSSFSVLLIGSGVQLRSYPNACATWCTKKATVLNMHKACPTSLVAKHLREEKTADWQGNITEWPQTEHHNNRA